MKTKFKEFMRSYYPQFVYSNEDESNITYSMYEGKSPNCSTAGCLFLLGIIPGIIYYLSFSKPTKSYTLTLVKRDNAWVVSGNYKVREVAYQFSNFIKD